MSVPTASFVTLSRCTTARTGEIVTSHSDTQTFSIPTPTILPQTNHGYPHNITADLLEKLEGISVLQLNMKDAFYMEESVKSANIGVHKFLVQTTKPYILCPKSALQKVDEAPFQGGAFLIKTPGGNRKATGATLVASQAILQADIWCSLAYDIPFNSSKKKAKKCTDNALKWLDETAKASPHLVRSPSSVSLTHRTIYSLPYKPPAETRLKSTATWRKH